MLNRVILMGRLTGDPELKTTPNGVSVTSFTLAVDRSYQKKDEERKADFISIVCWRNTAEFVCRYFGKGAMIALEGQIHTRTYQTKNGSNRYVTEVVADNVSFTGEKRGNVGNIGNTQEQSPGNPYNAPNGYTPPAYENNVAYSSSNSDFRDAPPDDDLPF